MSMTGYDLITELSGRTEQEFTATQCLIALNSAQDTVAGLADSELLKNLITTSPQTLSGAPPSISLTSINAIDNRYLSFTQVASPYMEYQIIDKQEANRLRRSSFLTPDRTNPKAYIIGQTLTSICSDDTTGVIDVEYIAKPSSMKQTSGTLTIGEEYYLLSKLESDDFSNVASETPAAGDTFIATGTTPTTWESGSVIIKTSELNSSLKEPLMLLGEAFLWRTDDELERSSDAYNKAMTLMNILNEKNMKSMNEDIQKIQASKIERKA